jgi:hypothetical protein
MAFCSNSSVPSHSSAACRASSPIGRDCLTDLECFFRYFPLEMIRVLKEVENGLQIRGAGRPNLFGNWRMPRTGVISFDWAKKIAKAWNENSERGIQLRLRTTERELTSLGTLTVMICVWISLRGRNRLKLSKVRRGQGNSNLSPPDW